MSKIVQEKLFGLTWLLPPKLNDEERSDRARVLFVLVSMFLIVGILLGLIDFFVARPTRVVRSITQFSIMMGIGLPLLVLLRKGYVDTVAYGFVLSFWFMATLLASMGGGIYAPVVQSYLVITFLAILIGGRRFAVWVGILAGLSEVSLAIFQRFIPGLPNPNPFAQLLVNIGYLVAVILVQDYSIRSLRRAMRKTIDIEKERQQVETTLVESQERFKAIFDQAEIGVVLSDLQGHFIEANQAFCQFVGYTISELQKMNFADISMESDLALEFQYIQEIMKERRHNYTLEKKYIRRDGTLIPVNLTVSLIRGLDNSSNAYLGIVQDISEKYSVEAALEFSEERFRIMFENAGVGIAQVDSTGHFIACNSAYTEIMGYTEAEILQHSFQDFMRPEDLPISDQGYKDLLTGKIDRYTTERQYVHKTGQFIWGRVTISLYRLNRVDSHYGVVVIFEDISSQKEAEFEIAAYNERLEESVENRTRELSDALQISEQALQDRDQFVANVSHELRTPLNAVIGLTHLTLATELDNKQKDYLFKVKDSASDLLQLVNDLLDFSKLATKRMQLESIPFPIKEMVKSIVDLESMHAKRKGLHLTTKFANNLPNYVMGDALRIRQVLLNLIGNAIKFTENGGITVQVDLSADKQWLEFSVTDTGIGIDLNIRPQLFTPFRQADSSYTRRFGGTGLGLAISKQIVDHMGGSIALDESWHQGSRFIFKIPLQILTTESKLIVAKNNNVNTEMIESNQAESNSEQIALVIEDNKINLLVVRELLRSCGLTVDTALNGKEGVDKALSNTYSVILMDLQMPVMDGFEATRLIRESNNQTPIIAVTAHVLESEIQKCLHSGMNAHIAKPIDAEKFYSTLSKWVKLSNKPPFNSERQKLSASFEIPGFDVQEAVHRLDNDESLYIRLLEYFVRDHRDDAFHLQRAIQSNDTEQVRHIIHRLKGTSSNLSAKRILCALMKVHESIEGSGINFEIQSPLIENLKIEIHNTIPLIEKLLIDRKPTIKRKKESTNQVSWQELDILLSRQSFQAKDYFYMLKENGQLANLQLIEKIDNAISMLDYVRARDLLSMLLNDASNGKIERE